MNFKNIAQDTLDIVKRGGYTAGVFNVKLEPFDKGLYISLLDLEDILKNGFKPKETYADTKFKLINESTVDTVFRLKNADDVGVLNFASAHHPGGGFLSGAMAQEEALAYCSNLYDTLVGNEFYKVHDGIKSKAYTDSMILGDVTFFKDSQFRLVAKPKKVKVLTSAAVNMTSALANGENVLSVQEIMKNRMRKILYVLANAECKSIVLGAFGCGVFGNDPNMVANTWLDLLLEEGLKKYFKEVIFTVYDKPNTKGNYSVFQEVFSRRLNKQ